MSQDDNILASEEKKPQDNAAKNSAGKVWDYLKSRFNKDNWFGSLLLPFLFYTYYQDASAARIRKVNGVTTPDRKRQIGAEIFMAEKAWSFFSARGGKFPEGKTIGERIKNAVKHPQISSTQFEWLVLFPARCLSVYSAATNGLKAYGIGLKPGEKAYKPERIRLFIAALQGTSTLLNGFGFFRRKKAPIAISGAPRQPDANRVHVEGDEEDISVIRKLWNNDRVLFIGSLMTMIVPATEALEGWAKSQKSHAEATRLIRGALASCLIAISYTVYTFQRIVSSNYDTKSSDTPKAARTAGASDMPADTTQQQNDTEKEAQTNFAQKVMESQDLVMERKR